MPERVHTRFEASPEPPAKKPKIEAVATSSSAASASVVVAASNEETPNENKPGHENYLTQRKKKNRKAPSQIARSNRRAIKFQQHSADSKGHNSEQSAATPAATATRDSSTSTHNVPDYRNVQQNGKSNELHSYTNNSHFDAEVTSNAPANANGAQNKGNLKSKSAALQRIRQTLPIWPYAGQIRAALSDRNVLLLVGETGSGKSTQVPQFLLSERWCRPTTIHSLNSPPSTASRHSQGSNNGTTRRIGGCIAVTEPRRVAATTLARRVADEMGTPLGKSSPASTVGYSVRFDENTSPNTKIKFVTEGMLLQEMLRDPWLTRYSAVIIDEVHERGVNVDLLMGFLRRILVQMAAGQDDGRGGVPLRVVIMSATAEGSEIVRFFSEASLQDNRSVQSPSETAESDWSGLSDTEKVSQQQQSSESPAPESTKQVATLYFKGRQHPVKILYSPRPVEDILEASLVRIFAINYQEPLPGDILVFLTGQKQVESLCTLIEEYSATLSKSVPRLLALPLFAALPQEAQRRVFEPTPPRAKGQRGIRKVIVSTNIAETSITVSGVRYVIDGGKEKVKQFRPHIGLDSLLTKPISHSSAVQRAGRAGREAPGCCYRLYTDADFGTLIPRTLPELLRCDLAQAVLALIARGVPADAVDSFPLLTAPPRESLRAALIQLHQLGAVDDDGHITESGALMAGLPVGVSMAKALLKASEPAMACLDDMIDLIAAMSGEGIFLAGNEDEDQDNDLEQRSCRDDLWRREGDHATMITAVRGFAAEHGDRRKWAETHGLSWRAMRGIMDIRKQLLALRPRLSASSSVRDASDASVEREPSSPIAANVLRCLLAGFPLNAAILSPDGSYRTVSGRQAVAIHPSSVLFRRTAGAAGPLQGKPAAIVYTEFVFTSRAYARGVSAVEVDWVVEALGTDWTNGTDGNE